MATNIIMHKKDGVSSEVINEAFVRLLKFRIKYVQRGFNEVEFFCLTNEPEGLLDEIHPLPIKVDPLITDEDYYRLQLLGGQPALHITDGATKNILWNPRLVPLDLCQISVLTNIPDKGQIKQLQDDVELDVETLKTIKDKNLPFAEMPMKWWDDEDGDTEFKGDWYFAWNSDELSAIKTTFEDDITNTIDTYSAKGGVQGFIEANFKGVVLPTKIGQFTPYYVNNDDKNVILAKQWEEKIRPYFPEEWHSPDKDEMSAFLFSWDHEYRTVSKQVQFLYMDGDDEPKSDMYARLWFL